MPIVIPENLPATQTLTREGVFVIPQSLAVHQDIRPVRVLLLNLMPTKVETETQISRLLANSPLQVELTLLRTDSYRSTNTSSDHLDQFYRTFDQVRRERFDGLIVTGAPVEQLEWTDVEYWNELTDILDWSTEFVHSSFYICWGAQAALRHFHGVPKHALPSKHSGVFLHRLLDRDSGPVRGLDDEFWVPVSRHTEVRRSDIEKHPGLRILADSPETGLYLVYEPEHRRLFSFNHAEYDRETLACEYERDVARGLRPSVPKNYFPADQPSRPPILRWRSHAALLVSNWLNYDVYQPLSVPDRLAIA